MISGKTDPLLFCYYLKVLKLHLNSPLIPLASERLEASSKRLSLPLLAQELCGLNGPKPIILPT